MGVKIYRKLIRKTAGPNLKSSRSVEVGNTSKRTILTSRAEPVASSKLCLDHTRELTVFFGGLISDIPHIPAAN